MTVQSLTLAQRRQSGKAIRDLTDTVVSLMNALESADALPDDEFVQLIVGAIEARTGEMEPAHRLAIRIEREMYDRGRI